MDKLRTLRDWSDTQYRVEADLLRAMTASEGLQTLAKLQNAFAWQLEQTASLFGQDHRQNLVELQARLSRLIE